MRARAAICVAAVLAFLVAAAAAAPAATLVLPAQGSIRLLPYAGVATGTPSEQDVVHGAAAFQPYAGAALAGSSIDAWLRFSASAPNGGRWVLVMPETQWVELFAPTASGGYQRQISGTDVAFAQRSLPVASPAFLLDVPRKGSATYYLHVRYHADRPLAPAVVDTVTFFQNSQLQRLVYGSFIGALLTVFALAIYIVIVLRYPATGLFATYLLAMLVNELVTTGIGNEYLWPNLAVDARSSGLASNTLAFAAFLFFVRTLLSTRRRLPFFDVTLLAVFVVQVALAILEYALPNGAALLGPLLGVEILGSVVFLVTGIARWRQGSRTAIYFVCAFVPVSAGTLANIAYDVFLPPGNWFLAQNGVEFGTMLMWVMMSAIVLARINLVHRERLSAKSQLSIHAQRNVELRRLASIDPLTGVANRAVFCETLEQAIGAAVDTDETLGVLYLDIDDFKDVNDRGGHQAGDELLRAVANRLTAVARERDLVARLGGDEFGVLVRKLPSASTLDMVRARIDDALAISSCAVSIGASLYPRDGMTADAMLDAADRSMYRIKQARKSAKARRDVSPA